MVSPGGGGAVTGDPGDLGKAGDVSMVSPGGGVAGPGGGGAAVTGDLVVAGQSLVTW